MMNNWEEAVSTAQRVLRKVGPLLSHCPRSHGSALLLKQDPLDLDALRLICLYLLARESKSGAAENRIAELMDVRISILSCCQLAFD
jgi:hypothetical protein